MPKKNTVKPTFAQTVQEKNTLLGVGSKNIYL